MEPHSQQGTTNYWVYKFMNVTSSGWWNKVWSDEKKFACFELYGS